jgi:hypothetical protein
MLNKIKSVKFIWKKEKSDSVGFPPDEDTTYMKVESLVSRIRKAFTFSPIHPNYIDFFIWDEIP